MIGEQTNSREMAMVIYHSHCQISIFGRILLLIQDATATGAGSPLIINANPNYKS